MDEYYIQEMETNQDTSFDVKDLDTLTCSFNCADFADIESICVDNLSIVAVFSAFFSADSPSSLSIKANGMAT